MFMGIPKLAFILPPVAEFSKPSLSHRPSSPVVPFHSWLELLGYGLFWEPD